MKLGIDNFDQLGAVDYSPSLDPEYPLRILRRLNRPMEMRCALVAEGTQFQVPAAGARVRVERDDSSRLFTGYVASPPDYEYLGWGQRGPVYRYLLHALGDEYVLDRKVLPERPDFVNHDAGDALRLLTEDLLPGEFDFSGVSAVATLPSYSTDPQTPWSEHAAALALRARARYRLFDGALEFVAIPPLAHVLSETSAYFSPDSLQLRNSGRILNDLTVTGRIEPRLYVKDYFLGDGLSLYFDLSHGPFTRYQQVLLDEEYKDGPSPQCWELTDPQAAISVSGGALAVNGGTGMDGQTGLRFVESLELGGALALQHGEVSFTAPSDGVIGGLYSGEVGIATCLAGFRITPSGSQSVIRPLINGVLAGSSLTTQAGHRYALTTRVYSQQIYRSQQLFHSSA